MISPIKGGDEITTIFCITGMLLSGSLSAIGVGLYFENLNIGFAVFFAMTFVILIVLAFL